MIQAKLSLKSVKMQNHMSWPHVPSTKIVNAISFNALDDELSGQKNHFHTQGQLVLSIQGIVSCEVADSHWIVPPHCALWIPAGIHHESKASANARGYFLFITPLINTLPDKCCTLSISPMLKEMIIEFAESQNKRSIHSKELITQLVLDELSSMPMVNTHFPIPDDLRLKRIAKALIENPADRKTIKEWSVCVGLSQRTLSRQLFKETGMSFGKWRRQLYLMVALKLLTEGKSVQQVAEALGYEAVTSFITMFKMALGTTPAKYLSLN